MLLRCINCMKSLNIDISSILNSWLYHSMEISELLWFTCICTDYTNMNNLYTPIDLIDEIELII